MLRKTLIIIVGATIILASIFWHYIGAILMIATIIILLYFTIILLISLLRYVIKRNWIPKRFLIHPLHYLLLVLMGFVIIFISSPSPLPKEDLTVSRQLSYMYKTDQRDRGSMMFLFMKRDKKRIQRTYHLLESGLIKLPQDKFYAALILQHGHNPTDYKTAYELASDADEGGIENADWLKKATFDRWQISIGKPQKYNTQKNIKF